MRSSSIAVNVSFIALLFWSGASPVTARVDTAGQAVVAPDDARLLKLPVSLREEGRRILAETDENRRAKLAEALADAHAVAALDFLLALLDTDPAADVREDIVDQLENV